MSDLTTLLFVAGVYAVILLVIMMVPIWWDTKRAYHLKEHILQKLDELLKSEKIDKDSTKKIFESLADSPEGIPGLGRLLMTLGIVAIVGISLFHMLVLSGSFYDINLNPSATMSNQTYSLIKEIKTQQNTNAATLLTILGGAVSAIIGFYFGNKSATDATRSISTGGAASTSDTDNNSVSNRQSSTKNKQKEDSMFALDTFTNDFTFPNETGSDTASLTIKFNSKVIVLSVNRIINDDKAPYNITSIQNDTLIIFSGITTDIGKTLTMKIRCGVDPEVVSAFWTLPSGGGSQEIRKERITKV